MRSIVIAGLAAGFAAIAPAASVASAGAANTRNESVAATPSAGQSGDSERRLCVAEPRSESRINRPVCHTAREWIALEGEVPTTR